MRIKSIKKKDIIKVTCAIIKNDSISKVNVRYIAKKGGFSTYPIYTNFQSTDKLIECAIKYISLELASQFDELMSPTLEDFGSIIFDYVYDNPGIKNSFISNKNFATSISKLVKDKFESVFNDSFDDSINLYLALIVAGTWFFDDVSDLSLERKKLIQNINRIFVNLVTSR